MKTGFWFLVPSVAAMFAVACGDDEKNGSGGDGVDAGSETGGTAAASGGASNAGGKASPGGAAAAGGKANGGSGPSAGGAQASGGDGSAGGAAAAGGGSGDDAGAGGAEAEGGVEGGAGGADNSGGAGGADNSGGAGGADNSGGAGGAPPVELPKPKVLSLSPTGHDRLYGATYDGAGNLYAVGQLASSIDSASDYSTVLVKLLPSGELDPAFGDDGVALKNVAVGGGSREIARGVVLQSTGKIVVFGAAEHDPKAAGVYATDADLVLLRYDATGVLDDGFGDHGVVRLDLNSGVETAGQNGPTLSGADTPWTVVLAEGDALVLHGSQRGEGFMASDGVTPRTDTDWALLRLTADGAPDPTFGGGDGKVTLDIGEGGASPRGVTVLADGSIIAAGYTRTSVLGTPSQQPVLYKVTASGEFDATFATTDFWTAPGVWHDYATEDGAEAYGAVISGGKLVTIGYGPTAGAGVATDIISLRFSLSGDLDATYGENGAKFVDIGGYGDNGRGIIALPNGGVLGIGAGRAAPPSPLPVDETPEADALVIRLDAAGNLDTAFGPNGARLYDMGGTGDHFWGVSVSPDQKTVAIVGIAGGETGKDDDAVLLLLPAAD